MTSYRGDSANGKEGTDVNDTQKEKLPGRLVREREGRGKTVGCSKLSEPE